MQETCPQCHTYVLPTCITVLCVEGLETVTAVWSSILHDVALAAESDLALEAAEVLHVPVPALRFSALISKDDLQHRYITDINRDILN